MPKENKDKSPPETKGETPFQKFERLAKGIMTVPKEKIRESKDIGEAVP